MKLTQRGRIVVWVAIITALVISWGYVVAQHDRNLRQGCQQHAYDCNHLNPKWFKHGDE